MAGVFVTAFYSFRMYFLVFHGKERYDQNPRRTGTPHEPSRAHFSARAHDHHVTRTPWPPRPRHATHTPHESPWVVTVPLVLLAIPSVVIGFLTIGPMLYGDFFKDSIFINLEKHPAWRRWPRNSTARWPWRCTA
jgi:NADH-quinone oxidoreductase subunit L